MTGHERENRVIAEFVFQHVVANNEWRYMGAKFLVTDTADSFLVRHITGMVRH